MEIFTVAELRRGELEPVSFELLNLANLNKGGDKSNAIILGRDTRVFAERLAKYADKVWAIEDETLENYDPELYVEALFQVLNRGKKPTLVLVGDTSFGKEFAPYLAVKLNAPVQTDVVSVDLSNWVSISKYILQGKVMVDMKMRNSEFCVLTIRQGIFKQGPEVRGEVEVINIKPSISRRNFIKYIEPEIGEVDISKEDILVVAGRGIAGKMEVAEEFAQLLGGTVGGTRPVVDHGWLPKDRQVGLSGKTVRPKLYLGLGVSGASQHVMGMRDSELIFAINKDSEAPIFQVAGYGIIGDIFEIVPEIVNKLRQMKQSP
jgi:electron transfer flavoprotein alpha subunit